MTDSLRTQIDSILSQCRAVIELGKECTDGPWEFYDGNKKGDHCIGVVNQYGLMARTGSSSTPAKHDARFIAASRTLTPQLAAALIEAIGGLEYLQEETASTWLSEEIDDRLERIASTFT